MISAHCRPADEEGNAVSRSASAKCRKDPESNQAMLLVRVEGVSLAHPSAAKLRKLKQKEGTMFEGYMLRDDAPEVCPGLTQSKAQGPRFGDDNALDGMPLISSSPSSSLRAVSAGAPDPPRMVESVADHVRGADAVLAGAPRRESARSDNFAVEDAVVYPAGSYDIILVMDAREIKNKRDDDFIRDGLREKNIAVEVRALSIGDTAWIARGRNPSHTGELRECVLDYVVERKRLDDLVSSIRDGRYDEQKVSRRISKRHSKLKSLHFSPASIEQLLPSQHTLHH